MIETSFLRMNRKVSIPTPAPPGSSKHFSLTVRKLDETTAFDDAKTMLDRLVEKKAVKKSKQGKIAYYEPLLSCRQARRTALQMVLDQAFEGAFGPMMHFLAEDEDMSARERKELSKILSRRSKLRESEND